MATRVSRGRSIVTAFALNRYTDEALAVMGTIIIVEQVSDARWIAALVISRLLPIAVLSPVIVSFAHHRDQRWVLKVSALVTVAASLFLALDTLREKPNPLLVVVLIGVAAFFAAPVKPAAGRILASTVREDKMLEASGLFGRVEPGSLLVTPVVVSLLLILPRGEAVTYVSVAVASTFLLVLSFGRPRSNFDEGASEQESITYRILSSARLILSVRESRTYLATRGFTRFGYGAAIVLLALVPERVGAQADAVAYLHGALGLGALVGLLLASFLAWKSDAVVVAFAVIALGATFELLAFRQTLTAALFAMAIIGGSSLILHYVTEGAIHRSLPHMASAMALGVTESLTAAGLLVGGLSVPFLVWAVGYEGACVVTAGVVLVGVAVYIPSLIRSSAGASERRNRARPVVEALQKCQQLRDLSVDELVNLAEASEAITVPRGALVVGEGEEADAVYVIDEGSFAVHVVGQDASKTGRLVTLKSGNLFGEIGVLSRSRRIASVVADTESTLIKIPADSFVNTLTADLGVATVIYEGLDKRLHESRPDAVAPHLDAETGIVTTED